jgi:hypothetical protein
MIAKPEELTQSLHPLNHTSEHNRYHTKSDESLHLTSDEPSTEPQDRTQSLPYKERRLATAHEHHDMHLQHHTKSDDSLQHTSTTICTYNWLRRNMNAGLEHIRHLRREAGCSSQGPLGPVHAVRHRLQPLPIDGDVLRYTRSTLPIQRITVWQIAK